MDKYIVLCKERAEVYQIYKGNKDLDEGEKKRLRLRSIYNADIDYYRMRIPEEIVKDVKGVMDDDHILAALNKWPDLLQSSPLITRL